MPRKKRNVKTAEEVELKLVEDKIAELETYLGDYIFRTDGVLSGIGNIKNTQDIQVLLVAESAINIRQKSYLDTCKRRKIQDPPVLKFGNDYSYMDFISDIEYKHRQLEVGDKLCQLEEIRDVLVETMSTKTKRSKAMGMFDSITDSIKKLN